VSNSPPTATYAAVKKMDPRMPERGPVRQCQFRAPTGRPIAINWATEYQRTGDTKWLDKIKPA